MFNITSIQNSFRGVVGFRPSSNPNITPITTGSYLLDSDSGLYVTDISGIDYSLIQAVLTDDYTNYEAYLEKVYNTTVQNVVNDFWNAAKSKYSFKELLENSLLIQDPICYGSKLDFANIITGFKIRPFRSNSITVEALEFSIWLDVSGTFDVYVFNTLQKTVLEKKSITVIADSLTKITLSKAVINSQDGGELLIIIKGNDLPAGARGYSVPFQNRAKFSHIETVSFPDSAMTGADLPDLSQMAINFESRGLNLRVRAACDFTQLMVDNRLMFAKIIQLACARQMFMDGVMSNEFNAVTESKRAAWSKFISQLDLALYGYNDEKEGFVQGYFHKLDLDLSDLDNICRPCHERSPRAVRIPY